MSVHGLAFEPLMFEHIKAFNAILNIPREKLDKKIF